MPAEHSKLRAGTDAERKGFGNASAPVPPFDEKTATSLGVHAASLDHSGDPAPEGIIADREQVTMNVRKPENDAI